MTKEDINFLKELCLLNPQELQKKIYFILRGFGYINNNIINYY